MTGFITKGVRVVQWRLFAISLLSLLIQQNETANGDIRIATAGPMTGIYAWSGEQYQRAAELAVHELNARGGVLGQRVELIVGDDACDPDQAVALAHKLADDGVVFVAGHWCSHTSIPAAEVYENAGILQIAPGSASARLTEEGRRNVFRVCGRDDRQGMKVADYLASKWKADQIAILDDGTTWGLGVANGVRRRLEEHGLRAAVDESIAPGKSDYSDVISKMQAASVKVLFLGGYHVEAGLIFRQARDSGYGLQLVATSSMASEDFPMIAGPELEGTVMAGQTDMREAPQARNVVTQFRAQGYEPMGYTLYAYAAVQVWAQAVKAANSLSLDVLIDKIHDTEFDTVLGKIRFDHKGDVLGFDPWQWYVWKSDGTYAPFGQAPARN